LEAHRYLLNLAGKQRRRSAEAAGLETGVLSTISNNERQKDMR
jgi:hypothetical protein